jgi:glycine cleavage system H protein
MDGFSYHNIFETKGMEYLIIILFLALLIPFSIILNRKVKIKKQLQHVMGILTSSLLKVPQGVFYSRNHTWAHLAKSGIASVGLDDLLLHITGATRLNYLKNAGESIQKGDPMAVLDHEGKQLVIHAPISGTIVGNNASLLENPDLLHEDPYETGWIYKIKPARWREETGSLYLAETATEWSQKELERFKDFLSVNLAKYSPEASMITLQDGGELRDHLLTEMPAELWKDFQREFLERDETA